MKCLNKFGLMVITFIVLFIGCSGSKALLKKEYGDLKSFGAEEKYSIIMVPDTQQYFRAEKGPHIFQEKLNWIADHIDPLDVVFITHIGDVIEDGKGDINHKEWIDSVKFLKKLDEIAIEKNIPYSISLGDHDYNGFEKSVQGHSAFVKNYGKKRYQNYPWYGDSSNTETSHYQFFTANGRKFLHINLECDAPRNTAFPEEEDQLQWAQKIIDIYPNIPTIISTHAYITDEVVNGIFIGHEPEPEVKKEDRRKGEDRRGGLDIWEELVSRNDQIFMVLCGNYHEFNNRKGDTGEYHQVSKNKKGRDVVEILANYQDYPNGGNGWFRIVVFDETNNSINVKTYSPFHREFRQKHQGTPRSSDFKITFNFAERLKLSGQ